MKSIKIDHHIFYYEIKSDCSEAGCWSWTEFFLKTKIVKRKRFFFFGAVLYEEIGDKKSFVFEILFNIEDPRYTKLEVKKSLNHQIELWKRPAELKRNEII